METKKRLVGISTGALQDIYGDMEAIRIASRIGADTIDFSVSYLFKYLQIRYDANPDAYASFDDAIAAYCQELKDCAAENHIAFSQTHSRGCGYTLDEEYNVAFTEKLRQDLLATSLLGAPVCIVHNTSMIFVGPDVPAETMRDLSYRMYSTIVPMAKGYGVKVAMETFGDAVKYPICDFFGQLDEFIKSFEAIKEIPGLEDSITLCADTGHSNKAMRYGNPTPADAIRRMGSNVTTLHLNDNDTLTDQHKIPKMGTIDWDDVFDALDSIGYSGVYNMELNLRPYGNEFLVEMAEFAVKVMRRMLKTRYGE